MNILRKIVIDIILYYYYVHKYTTDEYALWIINGWV